MYSTSTIAPIIHAKLFNKNSNIDIEHLLIDSRKLLFPESSLFFALNSPRRDSNMFISSLYNKGVKAFVVNENFNEAEMLQYPAASFLQVPNVLEALQLLATYHRNHFNLPVIGITGSNGKTIVKEWLYQLLNPNFDIVRSPRSYNSQIGVPLSIWQINNNHTLAIIEAGISQPGEMEKLQKIIIPGIGILTNIGDAHNEGFANTNEKITEKLQLFVNSNLLVYGADNNGVIEAVQTFTKKHPHLKLFSWGKAKSNSLQISNVASDNVNSIISANYKGDSFEFKIPFTDNASIENSISCCCLLLSMDISVDKIIKGMYQLKPVEMRLELKRGINNCSIINDSYSADINSLTIALDFLQQQQQHKKRTVILSDILQSGKSYNALYAEVSAILQQKKINRFIGIGTQISAHKSEFIKIAETSFFNSSEEFIQHFHSQHFHNETILLKGARVFEFEQISHLLEEKTHQTILEVDLNAITHNLNVYKQMLKPSVKLMAMVKAFSYGSGSFEIANLLQFNRVDYLAVAYTDEGVELRKAGITLPIMVMNAEAVNFDMLVTYNLEPELFSFKILSHFETYLKLAGIINYPVHLKLDTGMHRLGFPQKEIEALCTRLVSTQVFKIQSVFSHLAASDAALHDEFTNMQAKLFLQACEEIQKNISYSFIRHLVNTSGIHRHYNFQFDMVRLGIGLYGLDADAKIQTRLKNVTTLKTTVSQIKKINSGDSIGYNRSAIAKRDLVIATVGIGYADGYPRILSSGEGKMLINGRFAPVVGNVCMDMTMLDVTGIPVEEGDEVIVFGNELSVNQLALMAKTIPYEIITGISQRVKRVYFEE